MDISARHNVLQSYLAPRLRGQASARPVAAVPAASPSPVSQQEKVQHVFPHDPIGISQAVRERLTRDGREARPKLIRDETDILENGFRRTQEFENAQGTKFTRIESFTLTQNGARRQVQQQNPSGRLIAFEENFVQKETGVFTRTQRFQDESGETQTTIDEDVHVDVPFEFLIAQGGGSGRNATTNAASDFRGTQIDLRA